MGRKQLIDVMCKLVSQPKTPNPNPPPRIQMYPDANEPKEFFLTFWT